MTTPTNYLIEHLANIALQGESGGANVTPTLTRLCEVYGIAPSMLANDREISVLPTIVRLARAALAAEREVVA